MERLTTLKDLKVGQRVTEITKDGHFICWILIGRDPLFLPEGKDGIYWNNAYFTDILDMQTAERWHLDTLKTRELYLGFDRAFTIKKCIEKTKEHLNTLKETYKKYDKQSKN